MIASWAKIGGKLSWTICIEFFAYLRTILKLGFTHLDVA